MRIKAGLAAPALGVLGRLLVEHPRARELFPRCLAAGYYVARAMVPLMEAALVRAQKLADTDPVSAGLAQYLERHIPEEMHGEEPGAATRDDLAVLGVDPLALQTDPPPPKVAAAIGAQYFWIFHFHPVAILGFLQLEDYHPHAETLERLIEHTQLPRKGFRQLLLHSKLDIAHARELHRVIDSLPLEPSHERLIGISALQTIGLLADAFLDVVNEHGSAPVHP